jgi:hypothetical protein
MGDAIIICGLPAGQHAKFLCRCCGLESDDPEDFAVTVCWPCADGNPDCETCVASGVEIARHGRAGKAHRFAEWSPGRILAITTCGYRIRADDIGGAINLQPCRKCWPDYVLEAAA